MKSDEDVQSLITERLHSEIGCVKKGGRGQISIEDCIDTSLRQLEKAYKYQLQQPEKQAT